MNSKNTQKIFCIGFNKTGTTSLHNFFKSCGLSSIHNTEWCHYSYAKNGNQYFSENCYSDGEQCNFIQLQKWFPNALFILNTRSKKSWLYSRVKHVLRHNKVMPLEDVLVTKKYGKMAKDFFTNDTNAIRKWIIERQIYHQQARSHFKNKTNFLEIDITTNENWHRNIYSFFQINKIQCIKPKNIRLIHKNKRDINEIKNKTLLEKYFQIIDKEILQESQNQT